MMKVFTTVFVLEGQHATFAEIDQALRRQVEHAETTEVTDTSRRPVARLELWMEVP